MLVSAAALLRSTWSPPPQLLLPCPPPPPHMQLPCCEASPPTRCCAAGVLVHCGAGVSRSATLCMAYLMRRFGWNATKARTHCHDRRSLVNPNHGFWQALCAFEPALGITDRWVPLCCKGLRPAGSLGLALPARPR